MQGALARAIPCPTASVAQIPFALLLLISPELFGFIAMVDGTDPAALARGYRHYRVATFFTIAILAVIATGPRIRHQPIALTGDNSEVYAALLWSILAITAAAIIFRLLAATLVQPYKTRAERLIIGEVVALILVACLPGPLIMTLALLERLHLTHTLALRQAIYSHAGFLALIAALPLAAGPCIAAIQALLHRDMNGRTWRRLQPLWTDLTAIYPDTVLDSAPRHLQPVTDLQLHRVIIEIRDALMQLDAYITEPTSAEREQLAVARGSCGQPALDHRIASYALQIAKAAAHQTVTSPGPAGGARPTAAVSREDELDQLLDLAAWWPVATKIAT